MSVPKIVIYLNSNTIRIILSKYVYIHFSKTWLWLIVSIKVSELTYARFDAKRSEPKQTEGYRATTISKKTRKILIFFSLLEVVQYIYIYMVLEEIHNLEEVTRIATAVGQRKQAHRPRKSVQKTELSQGATLIGMPNTEFPYKGIPGRFTNTSQPSCLGVNYIWPIQSVWENCLPQTYSHWMWDCQ